MTAALVQLPDRLRWRRDRFGIFADAQIDAGGFYGVYPDGPCCEHNPDQRAGWRVMLSTWSQSDFHHHDTDLGFASTAEAAQAIAERHWLATQARRAS
jgi:hypothetical protein